MRVIAPAPPRIRPEVRGGVRSTSSCSDCRRRAPSSSLGVVLALAGKIGRTDTGTPAQPVVPLHALSGPADLEPLLTMFDSPTERQAVARALHRRANEGSGLEHVGGLATVTLPAAEIRADRRLVQLRERLARRPDSLEVAVLSRQRTFRDQAAPRRPHDRQFMVRTAGALVLLLAAFWPARVPPLAAAETTTRCCCPRSAAVRRSD